MRKLFHSSLSWALSVFFPLKSSFLNRCWSIIALDHWSLSGPLSTRYSLSSRIVVVMTRSWAWFFFFLFFGYIKELKSRMYNSSRSSISVSNCQKLFAVSLFSFQQASKNCGTRRRRRRRGNTTPCHAHFGNKLRFLFATLIWLLSERWYFGYWVETWD